MQILLSRSPAGPGRTGKQEQEQISPNHVQAFFPSSVVVGGGGEFIRSQSHRIAHRKGRILQEPISECANSLLSRLPRVRARRRRPPPPLRSWTRPKECHQSERVCVRSPPPHRSPRSLLLHFTHSSLSPLSLLGPTCSQDTLYDCPFSIQAAAASRGVWVLVGLRDERAQGKCYLCFMMRLDDTASRRPMSARVSYLMHLQAEECRILVSNK